MLPVASPTRGRQRQDRFIDACCPTLPSTSRPSQRSWCFQLNGSERAEQSGACDQLTCVSYLIKLTHMEKTQVYLRKEELDALRKVAARSRRSVAALVREAVRKVVLMPAAEGPIAIWDGEPKRSSLDHDSVHDEP